MRLLKPIAVLPPHHENVGILTYIVNFFQVLNFGQLRCGIEISNCITFQERVCPKMLPRCPRKRTDSNGVFWGTWVTQLVDSWFHGFMTLGFMVSFRVMIPQPMLDSTLKVESAWDLPLLLPLPPPTLPHMCALSFSERIK